MVSTTLWSINFTSIVSAPGLSYIANEIKNKFHIYIILYWSNYKQINPAMYIRINFTTHCPLSANKEVPRIIVLQDSDNIEDIAGGG